MSHYLFILSFLFFGAVKASEKIVCHGPHQEKAFMLKDNRITFLDHSTESGRKIANVAQIKTIRHGKGWKKTMKLQNIEHQIIIHNTEKFDPTSDSLTLTSSEGYKMTYPLTCQKV